MKTAHGPLLKPLVLAIQLSLAAGCSIYAINSYAENQYLQSYNIGAGSLSDVLTQFSLQSGITLTIEHSKLEGLKTAGLSGQYSIESGFNTLLENTPYTIQKNKDHYILVNKPQVQQPPVRDMGQLKPIDVTASGTVSRDANTVQLPIINVIAENENSYAVKNTSTATKMNLSIRETPQSISVVTKQRMDDQALTSITKVLEQTPGVTIARNSSERFNIYSRGSEITKYQYDGLTTHVENGTQNMTQNLADMSIYDRIEVVRGATGLMTGAGDVSGMVNMIRKKPTKEFQASVEGSVGRWDDYRGQFDVSGSLIESGKLRGRFVAAKQDNDSFTDYRSQKREAYYGVMEADITDRTTLRFGIDYNKYEANGGADVPLFYTDGEQTNFPRSITVTSKHKNQKLETTNYFFNIDQALANDWKLVIAGGYMDVDRKLSNSISMAQNGDLDIDRETGDFIAFSTAKQINPLSQKSASINLQGPVSLFGREHQAIFGYEFSRYKSDWASYGVGDYRISNPSSIHEIVLLDMSPGSTQNFYNIQRGYYGALRINPVDRLHVILGARISDYEYRSAWNDSWSGYKKSGEVTPYAGLVYDLTPQQSVYFSYTDIFRPNSNTDINRKVIDPQVGANYETGWKGEFYDGRLNANVALYQVKRDNATELAGYDSNSLAYYRAIKGVETNGIDIEIAGEVLPGWNVGASYSYSRSEDAKGIRRTTDHPLDTVKLWNTYNFSGEWKNLTIGGGVRWQSKTSTIPFTWAGVYYQATQDDFIVVDAMAGYKFNQHFSASLNVNNIFDKKYYSGIGNLNMGFYGEPLNVKLGLKYQF